MEEISAILDEFPAVKVISDDVYEFLSYDRKHFPSFAAVGNNWQRTVTIYSGGKLFNATGWKVGWAVGPKHLINNAQLHMYASMYCTNAPVQVAMGRALDRVGSGNYKESGKTYEEYVRQEFEDVRNYMTEQLKGMDVPMVPLECESGYFMMADISKCKDLIPKRYTESHDFEELKEGEKPVMKNVYYNNEGKVPLDLAFCRWMAVERKVVMMPCSLFYCKDSPYRNDQYARLGICKGMDHTVKALQRLKKAI